MKLWWIPLLTASHCDIISHELRPLTVWRVGLQPGGSAFVPVGRCVPVDERYVRVPHSVHTLLRTPGGDLLGAASPSWTTVSLVHLPVLQLAPRPLPDLILDKSAVKLLSPLFTCAVKALALGWLCWLYSHCLKSPTMPFSFSIIWSNNTDSMCFPAQLWDHHEIITTFSLE